MKQTSWKLVFLVKMKRLFTKLLNKEGVWISPTSLSNQSLIDWLDIGIFWLKQKCSLGRSRLRDFVIDQYLCWDKVCIEREEIMKRI